MKSKLHKKPGNPYYIVAPAYRESSSGICSLHYLCHALNLEGFDAYIAGTDTLNPALKTPVLTDEKREFHESRGLVPVAVYSDIVSGNPLGADVCVRYMLNKEGVINGEKIDAGGDDLFFYYSDAFVPDKIGHYDYLTIPVYDSDTFSPAYGVVKSKKYLYLNRVPLEAVDFSKLPDGIEVLSMKNPLSLVALAEKLKMADILYSYELSGTVTLAMMSGCPVVALDLEGFESIGFSDQNLAFFSGNGYARNDTAGEIEQARSTLFKVREIYEAIESGFWDQLKVFAEKTQNKTVEVERAKRLLAGREVAQWLERRTRTSLQESLITKYLSSVDFPRVGIVIFDPEANVEGLKKTLNSLEKQNSLCASICPLVLTSADFSKDDLQVFKLNSDDYVSMINEVLFASDYDWFLLTNAGDEFTGNGLLIAGLELLASTDCRAVCCDEMYRQIGERLGGAFRPALNLDYLLSFPAGMARHWLFRRKAVLEVGGFDPSLKEALELDLILRLVNQGGLAGLGHISEPLLITEMPALANVEDERLAIIRHLQARGYPDAQVTAAKPGRYHLEYKHAGNPVVSVLITAGKHLSKLQRCIEGLLGSTAYQTFEILLVESHPLDQAVHEWLLALAELQEAKLRIVQPASQNMAAMLNEAANQALGDYLLFLAPDTATLEEDWLDNLLNHAQRAEVGGVGGRLLTPDGKIAQAIQILGLQGPVGNPYVGEKLDEPGYMQRLQVDQNVSALSQDCLMLPRDLYLQLGGLDEEEIPAPYAMTDLCLRIREAGYLLVWSPSVQLMLDRQEPIEVTAKQQEAMYAKWLPQLARDPAYNPNFSLVQPGGFKLADTQISWRPLDVWRPLPVVLAHPADTMGCGHYRVMQPFNALREAGMVDGALSVGLMHVVDLERYNPDAVILQRQIGEERLEAMRRIKAFSRAFKVYELDDYLPNLPMKSVHRQHMPKDIAKSLRRGLSYVDRFVVSTDVMAEAFADFHPDIRVVKNRLDPRWWGGLPVSARRTSKKPRVGWAGGSSHTGDLEMIADVVKELAGEVEWVFFGMCPKKLKPYVHEFHEGIAIESYAKKLASLNLDLALAPVEQNLFNECKSNLRLLEYGACGFPVICSDVRCYQGDGLPVTRVKNRFRDWADAIRSHINDLDSAARAGDELRAAVLNGWMLEGENLEAWRKVWLPD